MGVGTKIKIIHARGIHALGRLTSLKSALRKQVVRSDNKIDVQDYPGCRGQKVSFSVHMTFTGLAVGLERGMYEHRQHARTANTCKRATKSLGKRFAPNSKFRNVSSAGTKLTEIFHQQI